MSLEIRLNFTIGTETESYRDKLYGFLMTEGDRCYLRLEGKTPLDHDKTLSYLAIPLDKITQNTDIRWSQAQFSRGLLSRVLANLGKLHDVEF